MNVIGKLVFVERKGHPAWPVGVYEGTIEAVEHTGHLSLCGTEAANDG